MNGEQTCRALAASVYDWKCRGVKGGGSSGFAYQEEKPYGSRIPVLKKSIREKYLFFYGQKRRTDSKIFTRSDGLRGVSEVGYRGSGVIFKFSKWNADKSAFQINDTIQF